MAHFAQIDKDNKVVQVIVADQEVIDSGVFGNPSSWIQTSYNTKNGTHPSGEPLRMQFAGIGYTYDPKADAFIPPKPYDSWVLNLETYFWEAPISHPDDGKLYSWDEKTKSWKEMI